MCAAGILAFGTDPAIRGAVSSIDGCGTPSDDACTDAIMFVGEGNGEPDRAWTEVFLYLSGCFDGRDGADIDL